MTAPDGEGEPQKAGALLVGQPADRLVGRPLDPAARRGPFPGHRGFGPVPGQLEQLGSLWDAAGTLENGRGGAVEVDPLAGTEPLLDGVADQGMDEAVLTRLIARLDQARRACLVERHQAVQRRATGHGRRLLRRELPAEDRCCSQQLDARAGQSIQPRREDFPHVRGQGDHGPAHHAGGQDPAHLRDQKRVAAGQRAHLLGHPLVHPAAGHGGEVLGDRRHAETREDEVADAWLSRQFRDMRCVSAVGVA